MFKNLRFIFRYIAHQLSASGSHGIHSPFLFDLYKHGLKAKVNDPVLREAEKIRKELSGNNQNIEVFDAGTGYKGEKQYFRKISSIARSSAKPKKYKLLQYRLIKHLKPENIIELGSSFGFSTIYMAAANRDAKITTIEACPATAEIARFNFSRLKLDNIELINSTFEDALVSLLNEQQKADYIFFDGNHQKEPTIQYFETALKHTHTDSVFVFDDIHWSKGMEEAWKEISNHPSVSHALDFWFMGVVFFKESPSQTKLKIRY